MRLGIAYDLRREQQRDSDRPDDVLEEYDSEATVDAIAAALRDAGHEVLRLGGGREFLERALAASSGHAPVDLVFNIAEGRGSRSREAQVPAVCEMLGLPYTGSDPLSLALCLDKALSKRVAAGHGVATAAFCLVEDADGIDSAPFPPLPAIAKPNAEGSSIGVRRNARCTTREALADRVRALLADYRAPVLVEQFIAGVEVTVAILGTGPRARVVGTMEIAPRRVSDQPFVYSIEVKRNYRQEVDYHVPPRLGAASIAAIEACALAAYRALGCRDVGRVDLRLDPGGTPWLIEINPLPGLNPTDGDLPLIWQRGGRPYAELIAAILDQAVLRMGLAR